MIRTMIAAALVGLPGLALAQTPAAAPEQDAAPAPCFDVTFPNSGQQPFAPILFNRCTGQSWILVRLPIPPATGAHVSAQSHTFRWSPLVTATGEAQIPDSPPQIYSYPEIPGK